MRKQRRATLQSEIGELEAHCFSVQCYSGKSTASGTIKNVPAKTSDCPDCKSVLVWKSKNKRLTRSTKIVRFNVGVAYV